MLKIQYRDAKDGGIEVLRCFSKEDQVEIPSEIDGKRVTKIGDYAFSAHKRKEDEAKEIMIGEDFLGSEDEPMFCGEAVKEVYLPPDTVEIGKYAFYGCVNLTTLGFQILFKNRSRNFYRMQAAKDLLMMFMRIKKCFKRRCKRYSFSIAGKYPL